MAEVSDIKVKVSTELSERLTQTRVFQCMNSECKYSLNGGCNLKEIILTENGVCFYSGLVE